MAERDLLASDIADTRSAFTPLWLGIPSAIAVGLFGLADPGQVIAQFLTREQTIGLAALFSLIFYHLAVASMVRRARRFEPRLRQGALIFNARVRLIANGTNLVSTALMVTGILMPPLTGFGSYNIAIYIGVFASGLFFLFQAMRLAEALQDEMGGP